MQKYKNLILDLDGTLCESPAPHCLNMSTLDDIIRQMDPVKIAGLKPRIDTIKLIRDLTEENDFQEIHVISGRWDILSSVTRAWLSFWIKPNFINSVSLRKFEDYKLPAIMVKESMFWKLGLDPSLTIWVDDDADMCAMAESVGMKSVKV